MKYTESKKEGRIYTKKIDTMITWTVSDGSFERLLNKYFSSRGGSILDVGCGNGSTLLQARNYFDRLFGIDLESRLSEDIKHDVDFKSIDLNFDELPYGDESFDLITVLQVIEHLENPFFIMREIHRVLKEGGLFIMSVPNPYQITFRVKYLFTGNMPPWTTENEHLLFFTRDIFRKTYLKRFDLVEEIHQKGAIPFWGRLRLIFGKKLIKKHAMVLPRSELLGRRIGYVLRKKQK